MKNKAKPPKEDGEQLSRFKDMARKLGADETPGALDPAFTRPDIKKKENGKPVKRKAKAKRHILSLVLAVLVLPFVPTPRLAMGLVASQTPEAVVRTYEDAINARSVEGLMATTAEALDVRLYKPDGAIQYQKLRSRLEQRQSFEDMLRRNPNGRSRVISLMVSGPVVIARVESSGFPGGGSEIGATVYRVLDGRITQMWILNTEGVK